MISISSESQGIFEFIGTKRYSFVTFDIETLDNKSLNLWNEPVISFSLSFISSLKFSRVLDFPTFCFGITDTKKEFDLLCLLRKIFSKLPKNTVIIGHNISRELECKKIEGWQHCEGYDIPKILKRGNYLGLDMSIINKFKVYDTMQVAYDRLDHNAHGKKYRDKSTGEFRAQKILSSEKLEEILNVKRPKNIPKLGPKVRDFFQKKRYKDILLYNASDTIVESIFYVLFESQSTKNNNCQFSLKSLPVINIEMMGTWKRLVKNAKNPGI